MIVSALAGTTTDPVEKPMELLPLGPVLFIDTAGVDDAGALGEQRIARTPAGAGPRRPGRDRRRPGAWGAFEARLLDAAAGAQGAGHRGLQQIRPGAAAAQDRACPEPRACLRGDVRLDGHRRPRPAQGLLARPLPTSSQPPAIVADLVPPGELAVLVVPIDKEAPKGRLILPQVQTIRDLLDGEAMLVVQGARAARGARRLKRPPALVVTDSQAFLKVAADMPPAVPMTSFSILLARYKGDLAERCAARWPSSG